MTDIFSARRVLNTKAFHELIAEAETRRKSEIADEAGMATFNLPQNEPIIYTAIYPQEDPTEEHHARYFPGAMNTLRNVSGSPRYNFVTRGEYCIASSSNTLSALRQRFSEAGNNRTHYLFISAHGEAAGFYFGRTLVQPSQLLALFQEFPTCRFVVDVNACHSGGVDTGDFRRIFRDAASAGHGRITVFTHSNRFMQTETTTPDARNIRGGERDMDTLYSYYLIHSLSQGLPYGQAHLRADRQVKELFPGQDAGVYRSGPDGGTRTAREDIEGRSTDALT